MNKSESKYYNNACLMDQALLILLEKKDFDYITVKEVCEKAGVNRSTFYLHYETMEDILAETIDFLFDKLKSKFPDNIINVKEVKDTELKNLIFITPEFTIPYLEFVKENKKAFVSAVKQPNIFKTENTFNKMYKELFSPILSRFNVKEDEKHYIIKFYISGVHAIIIEWLKNNCKDEINFIADLITKCVNKAYED